MSISTSFPLSDWSETVVADLNGGLWALELKGCLCADRRALNLLEFSDKVANGASNHPLHLLPYCPLLHLHRTQSLELELEVRHVP